MEESKVLEAGKIASQIREYSKRIIKKNIPLLEIAEKIEAKILELGGKPAFPVNLSIDNIAAHYTPTYNDKSVAKGLIKIDIGVHIDGWIADTAFSIDLESSEENKKLIESSEKALEEAIKIFNTGTKLNEIGKKISETIESKGFSPIINLSGHEIEHYQLHAGLTIPNIDNKVTYEIKKGLYAIEPFASTGEGKVHDGISSGIYILTSEKNPRSPIAREILDYIIENYQTLPFCSRWIVKKFETKSLLGLKQLEDNGNLHHFPQLMEKQGVKISQAEHTLLIDKEKIITTK